MPSSADIFALGTHAGRPFFRNRSNASSRFATNPAFTSARATCGRPGDLQFASAKTVSAVSGTPSLLSSRHHFRESGFAGRFGIPRDFRQQFVIVRVEEITGADAVPCHQSQRELRAGNEFNSRRIASDGHARAAFDRIVIRQRHRRETKARAVAGEFFRRKCPLSEKTRCRCKSANIISPKSNV